MLTKKKSLLGAKKVAAKPVAKAVPATKTKKVAEALVDADTEFRCKDCLGQVKLHKSHKADGPGPHAEHKLRQDSEYCPSGMYFKKATDGREPRQSEHPVV